MEYFDGILILNGLLLKRVYLLHKIIHIISFKIILLQNQCYVLGALAVLANVDCKCIIYIFNINIFTLNAISVCFYPIKDLSTSGPTLY